MVTGFMVKSASQACMCTLDIATDWLMMYTDGQPISIEEYTLLSPFPIPASVPQQVKWYILNL